VAAPALAPVRDVAAPRLRFGTSGIPRSTLRPSTPEGIRRAAALGLGCMEMAWGNGIRMLPETCVRIRDTALACGIELTAHAPYFVNLCGTCEVVRSSERRIVEAARLAHACGARSLCFHPGCYPKRGRALGPARAAKRLARLAARLRDEGLAVDLRPELTGRTSQLGTLDETLAWCEAVDGISPCLDFAHLYARGQGALNRRADFGGVLDRVRARLGAAALARVHVHVSGIEFGPAGERRHRAVRDSAFRWRELLRALHDRDVAGWLVAESPAMEDDALLLQRTYRRMRAPVPTDPHGATP